MFLDIPHITVAYLDVRGSQLFCETLWGRFERKLPLGIKEADLVMFPGMLKLLVFSILNEMNTDLDVILFLSEDGKLASIFYHLCYR